MNQTISIQKLTDKCQMVITHAYNATIETLWNAHTKTEYLEKWWAPEPYKAIVVSNNFVNGGRLHYYMLSPEGIKHYCIADFNDIVLLKSYTVMDAFCDENAVINEEMPRTIWHNTFAEENSVTTVTNTLQFDSIEQLERLNELGFEDGYMMALNQLYRLLENNKK